MLRAEFRLSSITAEEAAPERKAPIRVKFEIPYFTVSGIQVCLFKEYDCVLYHIIISISPSPGPHRLRCIVIVLINAMLPCLLISGCHLMVKHFSINYMNRLLIHGCCVTIFAVKESRFKGLMW